jgi:hypothetical protein
VLITNFAGEGGTLVLMTSFAEATLEAKIARPRAMMIIFDNFFMVVSRLYLPYRFCVSYEVFRFCKIFVRLVWIYYEVLHALSIFGKIVPKSIQNFGYWLLHLAKTETRIKYEPDIQVKGLSRRDYDARECTLTAKEFA